MMISGRSISIIGLLIGCVLFGLGSLIVAHVEIGSYAMAFWRLLVSSMIFLLLAKLWHHPLFVNRYAIIFAMLSGAALALDLALWHESIHAVGPGISTLLNSLQIFFLALLGVLFFGERPNKIQLLSLLVAVFGVAMIASPEFASNLQAGWGFVSGILSGACLAISMVLIKKADERQAMPIFTLMTWVGVGGFLAILPFALIFDAGRILPSSWSQIGWILVYGSVMQCLAWGLIAYNIPKLSLALTGLLLLTEPVAALVIDYFWLNKAINAVQWLGACLTMLAIYLGSLAHKKSA